MSEHDHVFWYDLQTGALHHQVLDPDPKAGTLQMKQAALVPLGNQLWNFDDTFGWFYRPADRPKMNAIRAERVPATIKAMCVLLGLNWRAGE